MSALWFHRPHSRSHAPTWERGRQLLTAQLEKSYNFRSGTKYTFTSSGCKFYQVIFYQALISLKFIQGKIFFQA